MRTPLLCAALISSSLTLGAHAATEEPLFIPQSVIVPRKMIQTPAKDLVAPDGTRLDPDDVLERMKRGEDVSTYEPDGTDVYGGSTSSREIQYPEVNAQGEIELRYDSLVTSPLGLARARVAHHSGNSEAHYRLVMSWNLHSSLMNAELLRQLGYTIDLPRHYAKAKIRFPSVEERDAFLDAVMRGTGSEIEQWLTEIPGEKDLVVSIRDFALEPGRIATPPYYWGTISALEFQGRRVLRSLLVPLVLTTIPDSINRWTSEVAKIMNERVLFYHPFAGNFQNELTYPDARWIARKICAIDEGGLRAIVRAGKYPKSLDRLLLERLKDRRNHLMQQLEILCAPLPANVDLTYPDPETGKILVSHGKLLRSEFPGYGFKFIGEDPESPLRRDELFRFFALRGIGVGLKSSLDLLNSQVLDYDRRDANQMKNGSWALAHGPVAGLDLSATRRVTSGTYYGSESTIQMVNQISLSASLGYFLGARARAVEKARLGVRPNVGISRSYLHVKPVANMKEALKEWQHLPVIPKMRALSRLLDSKTEDGDQLALNEFLNKFLPGENFTLVDSVNLGIDANVRAPIALIGPISGNLSFAAGADHIVLRRTMFQRLADGKLQISLQRVRKNALSGGVGYELVIDIIRAEASRGKTTSDAEVYLIDTDRATDVKTLNRALKALLVSHDSSILEKNFKPFHLDHELKRRNGSLRVLPWIWIRNHEEHNLHANPPLAPNSPDHQRTLFSVRDRWVSGNDHLGTGAQAAYGTGNELLFSDIDLELIEKSGDKDPSSRFLGRSHWKETRTEAELTPGELPRALMSIEESYQGWTLSKKRLLRILERLERKALEVSSTRRSLMKREEFLSTEKLILYRIGATLHLSGPGLEELLHTAHASKNRRNFQERLLTSGRIRTSEAEGWIDGLYRELKKVPALSNTVEGNRERLKALHRVGKYLSQRVGIRQTIQLIGKENAFFQITVSGFRTKDETGDSQYVSDSIGQLGDQVGLGAFADFIDKQKTSAYEVRGVYLGDGT